MDPFAEIIKSVLPKCVGKRVSIEIPLNSGRRIELEGELIEMSGIFQIDGEDHLSFEDRDIVTIKINKESPKWTIVLG